MKAALPALTLAALLAGCVPYPIHKTLQPAARLQVLDGRGQPLADAEVMLITSNRFSRDEFVRQRGRSDAQGWAGFARMAEWRIETSMLHGSADYLWSWCVQRPGFLTWQSLPEDERFNREQSVRLLPGASRPCPSGPGE